METALAGWLGARAVHVPPPWPASLGCARSDPTSAPTWPAAGLGVPPMWAWFKTDLVAGPSPGPHLAMPAGVSLPTYLKMVAASLGAMLLGAEVVHRYYRPDLTIPEVPPKRGELKTELLGLKTRQEQGQISQQQ
ncbi:ubiquinol-cytochrome-c reductase complex assembly factor 6 isoform X2 [Monodelphis domestica]|uniref:ubiquinol-cytochrome-c reductase complex assembly factor 6 isoform X2 n=1 Tax=Monodelphis domestica TaxID=13616 RepID=UPI0024E1F678|nr:ubiquinol-cytochrome-c reductase complex assembly factor 6 isoform X2 [Monodelphis domestica]